MNATEIRAMSERIGRRREWAAEAGPVLPITPPRWADYVIDVNGELIAIHKKTGEPYPIDWRLDLSAEDAAILLARRILAVSRSRAEAERFVDIFGLDPTTRWRLIGKIRKVLA